MGVTSDHMEPGSPGYYNSRFPVVFLPPNDQNFYVGTAATPQSYTLDEETCGVPTTVHASVGTANNFTTGKNVKFTVTGYDWQYKATTDSFTLVGGTDTVGRTDTLFSKVTDVTATVTLGTSTTGTFFVGIGDGSSSPDIGVLAPWKVPDGTVWASAPAFKYILQASGFGVVTPDGECSGRMGVTVDYAASVVPQSCMAVWQGSEFDFKLR